MTPDFDEKKARASAWFRSLRDEIVAAFEGLEDSQTEGPMAKDIPLTNQRPAAFVFSDHVEKKLAEIRATQPRAKKVAATS